jgi:putative oxidoreductase
MAAGSPLPPTVAPPAPGAAARSGAPPAAGPAVGVDPDVGAQPDSHADRGPDPRADRRRRRLGSVTLETALRWAVVGIFVGAGGAKLLALGKTVALFDAVGLGQWFRYVTGVGELTGAALLATPRTVLFGALVLGTLMVGAMGTEIFVLRRLPVSSVTTLAGLVVIVWLRLRPTLRPAPRPKG